MIVLQNLCKLVSSRHALTDAWEESQGFKNEGWVMIHWNGSGGGSGGSVEPPKPRSQINAL